MGRRGAPKGTARGQSRFRGLVSMRHAPTQASRAILKRSIEPLRLPVGAVCVFLATADFLLGETILLASNEVYHRHLGVSPSDIWETIYLSVTAGLLLVAFMAARGAYTVSGILDDHRAIKTLFTGWLFVFFAILWLAFLTKTTSTFSRGSLTLAFAVGFPILLSGHVALARVLKRLLAAEKLVLRTAYLFCAGDPGMEQGIIGQLGRQGIAVCGVSNIENRDGTTAAQSVHAGVAAAQAAFRFDPYGAVYLFCSWDQRNLIERIVEEMSRLPLPIYLFADAYTDKILAGCPLHTGWQRAFEVQRAPLRPADRLLKRSFDIVFASLLLLFLFPLMAVVACAIARENGRPVLFRQARRGFCGKPFDIYKFRSMTVQENGREIRQAQRNDGRVTRLGRILRRSNIDELPQLFNVLRGEMSLVGPRPHAVAHDDTYSKIIESYAYRHRVKPGLTGWAQINGFRGETKELWRMEKRVEHDLWYINSWSAWLDLKIIWKTAFMILSNRDVY
ncbi:MAG: exopolysaccharide biosynthesis polyprenyl glycosylphosphotransferase [Mesorhizobium sp.]|nr:MAG: exopolysaccharide biosynthesis polyprenyl glycosylphosphotransferase [Mesorhizobium sp.]RWG83957.1 MAG: exopolysaccharide biosynthesis polyprenyl glycosylphosphotransferase [Mesorhizobium sp.]RWK08166.1 MAG: exopolysaccharide biosynthesis polyprenyl glycosylphosphotransferase [Mesorhizobium sp.]RWK08271.1 MAG: exopolysaccharide biosynthesis polyprenyl glycosylphosphotransferase [Mesorhizobium sp.]RWK15762.1 MAG: exopolysaccharide biosynthesis polyprenyl glycosylphosphotransferase [Mesor